MIKPTLAEAVRAIEFVLREIATTTRTSWGYSVREQCAAVLTALQAHDAHEDATTERDHHAAQARPDLARLREVAEALVHSRVRPARHEVLAGEEFDEVVGDVPATILSLLDEVEGLRAAAEVALKRIGHVLDNDASRLRQDREVGLHQAEETLRAALTRSKT